MKKLTKKQTEALARLRVGFSTFHRRPSFDVRADDGEGRHTTVFSTGEHSRVLARLRDAGCIEGLVYRNGDVADLKILEGGEV